MKRIKQLSILGILFGWVLTNQAQQFTVKGTIEQPQPTKAVLLKIFDAQSMQYKWLQNIRIAKDGSFQVALPFAEMNLYELNVYGKKGRIVVEKPENIQVVVKGKEKLTMKITGSTGNQNIRAFHNYLNQLQGKHFGGLKARAMKAVKENNLKEMAALEIIKNEKMKVFEADLQQFIEDLGVSAAAYYAIGFMDLNMHLDFFKKVGERFKQKHPGYNLTQALWKNIESAQKTAIGALAPNFTLKDLQGQTQSLTDYRGKYVVIEFWASWCLGCRIEYPKLKKIYAMYKTQGLEILGVSDDRQTKPWKAAVTRDQLPWPNLWIGKNKVRKDYNISNLPFNLLLDKQGRIIAKKLTPEQLETKLKALMKEEK
ncbi:MAG TPA: hypothetical protein DCS93_09985 [Microscillaceae bacterium]|nr:hypothetical protein [Microscillaceae bacterium]